MKNLTHKLITFIKFNRKAFVFSTLFFFFFTPFFSQAHPNIFHEYPPQSHFYPPQSHFYPPINTCSSACQTFSGSICPLVNYNLQSFSACLTDGPLYFCLNSNSNLFNPNPVCLLKRSPCVCAYPNVDYFHGTIYYVYENGFTL